MAENLDVDYQMLINFGEYEPFYGPYNAINYFLSFFIKGSIQACTFCNFSQPWIGLATFKTGKCK